MISDPLMKQSNGKVMSADQKVSLLTLCLSSDEVKVLQLNWEWHHPRGWPWKQPGSMYKQLMTKKSRLGQEKGDLGGSDPEFEDVWWRRFPDPGPADSCHDSSAWDSLTTQRGSRWLTVWLSLSVCCGFSELETPKQLQPSHHQEPNSWRDTLY